MRVIRRQLAVFTFVVAACQVAAMAATPLALCCISETPATDSGQTACTCGHAAGAECPLHKHKDSGTSSSASSSDECRCSSSRDNTDTMLTRFVTFTGPLVARHQMLAPEGTAETLAPLSTSVVAVPHAPLSPPPRG